MAMARIVDETGRTDPWTDSLGEILGAAGYGLSGSDDDSADLTVLLTPEDGGGANEDRFRGDLLVILIPRAGSIPDSRRPRTDIIGTSRIKARYRLPGPGEFEPVSDEIRTLVKLFL